eukprot:364591-Chlamydomonas_euryale.AAC.12
MPGRVNLFCSAPGCPPSSHLSKALLMPGGVNLFCSAPGRPPLSHLSKALLIPSGANLFQTASASPPLQPKPHPSLKSIASLSRQLPLPSLCPQLLFPSISHFKPAFGFSK